METSDTLVSAPYIDVPSFEAPPTGLHGVEKQQDSYSSYCKLQSGDGHEVRPLVEQVVSSTIHIKRFVAVQGLLCCCKAHSYP